MTKAGQRQAPWRDQFVILIDGRVRIHLRTTRASPLATGPLARRAARSSLMGTRFPLVHAQARLGEPVPARPAQFPGEYDVGANNQSEHLFMMSSFVL
jgi:hypothetical protein